MPWVGLCFVIVAFPGQIHFFFLGGGGGGGGSMQRFNGFSRISKAYAVNLKDN